MKIIKWGQLGCVAALVCAPRPGQAFTEPGHRAIEAAAYEELLSSGNPVDLTTIKILIDKGVLAPPVAIQPQPSAAYGPSEGYEGPQHLALLSHMADHHFDRQLESDRQCFHFNARSAFVTELREPYPDLADPGARNGLKVADLPVPRGLIVDAYRECVGVADLLLRNILTDPVKARETHVGIYELIHLIEDSFSDSHVGRDQNWRIIYVKPWNIRSFMRYSFGQAKGLPIDLHFSDRHHMTAETRDLAYALGPYDENYNLPTPAAYQARLSNCLSEATARLPEQGKPWATVKKPDGSFKRTQRATLYDLQSEMVIPPSCLSDRGLFAARAIRDLLRLVAKHMASYAPSLAELKPPIANHPGLEADFRQYRCRYLAHMDLDVSNCDVQINRVVAPPPVYRPTLTMSVPVRIPLPEQQKDRSYSAARFETRAFRNAGAGLTTELRTGTPLWLTVDLFASRDPTSHHAINVLLDTLAWGVQVRLPIEDEHGEKPVGVAGDFGPGLPLPVSELLGVDELQIYAGIRGRVAYTAQSIFSDETRHSLEVGFGGLSLDFIIGQRVWFGLDAPRRTYTYDLWLNEWKLTPTWFSFSGGIATDAF